MKKKNIDAGFYHKKAEDQIQSKLRDIKTQIKNYASDMAGQSRPALNDPQELYLPKIQSLFKSFLERVLQIIGAFAVLNQVPEMIQALYQKEVDKLNGKKEALLEDIRLLQKELQGLTDISGLINRWRYKWRPVLVLLTFGETAVNYRALLTVTPNQGVAIIASIALSIFLFITAHSLKDLMNLFSSRGLRIASGAINVILVISLLVGLNEIRLSYLENDDAIVSGVSKYSFIALNFSLWTAGFIIAIIHKPSRAQILKHHAFVKVKKELNTVQAEVKAIDARLDEIPDEEAQKILDLKNLKSMARHYELIICAEYTSSVADFKEHNLFSRKDKVTPKSFIKEPPKLRTYFDHIHQQQKTRS